MYSFYVINYVNYTDFFEGKESDTETVEIGVGGNDNEEGGM